jgi:hypothetical protein
MLCFSSYIGINSYIEKQIKQQRLLRIESYS